MLDGTVEGGVPASSVPSHKRDLKMLFQSYAPFPLSVADNVAFELKVGNATRYHLTLADGTEVVAESRGPDRSGLAAGAPVRAGWDPERSRLLAE
ncbi:TOBE domain-containing protein [Streptomyces sp. NPDC003023]|uniref:TOBE domain-containing protein n=1 Tax=Streptomyces sp. NPDC003023 TaxID=3364675 RepID=UPI00369534F2